MSKKINYGKRFEQDFFNSIPGYMYKIRIKDDTLRFKNVKNPADIIVFYNSHMYLLELKSTQQKSLQYNNVGEHQFKGLYEASQINGIIAGFVINFRSVTQTYFLDINKAITFIKNNNRKSFPLEFVQQEGILINCAKKRTRYNYNVNDIIKI